MTQFFFFHCCIVQHIRYQPSCMKQLCFHQTACYFKRLYAVCPSRCHEFFIFTVVLKNCPLTHQNKNRRIDPPRLLKVPSSCDQATSRCLQTKTPQMNKSDRDKLRGRKWRKWMYGWIYWCYGLKPQSARWPETMWSIFLSVHMAHHDVSYFGSHTALSFHEVPHLKPI